jgi:hypothetical protein
MRFFLDENESPEILNPLRLVFPGYHFRSWADEKLQGTMDPAMIREVAARGFDGILTRDVRQLSNPIERSAYVIAQIHWIGHAVPDAAGQEAKALTTAAYLGAIPHIVRAAAKLTDAHAFHIRNLPSERGQRVKIARLLG